MRIFCAVRHANDPKYYYGGLWSGNFYPALRELGHEIIESQTDLLPTSRFMHIASGYTREELAVRARTTEHILDEVRVAQRAGKVDLFLGYFYNTHFDPAGFDELRRMGVPSVNYYCNSIYQFDYVAAIAAKVDFSWHAEKHARDSYLKVGAKPVWVQMAADPKVYGPVAGVVREPKACFVGQRYADRDRWMAALVQAGVPVNIYGPGWGVPPASFPASGSSGCESAPSSLPESQSRLTSAATEIEVPGNDAHGEYLGRHTHKAGSAGSYLEAMKAALLQEGLMSGLTRIARQARHRRETKKLSQLFVPFARGSIPFSKISEVFSAHEVCLNFSNVWADGRPGSALIPHVRLRDFEAPMCRTCYLTGHTEEIEEFYEVGKEIDTYRSPEELVDKARFYLKNPSEAERLREAGYRRALRDHTWVRRFQELFGKIGIGSSGEN